MATFDQLSAEQRAIVELILKQGQSYDQLSDMLGLPAARVRDLARQALVRLSPVSAAAVDDEWQVQLTDYLLNQQSGPEATATRGHLRRSEAARGWARSVLDSLEQFYGEKNIPSIPEGEARAEREPRQKRERRPARPRRELSPDAQAAIKRRRLLGAGALAALLLALILTVLPGVGPLDLTGGDDEAKSSSGGGGGTQRASPPQVVGQLTLAAVESLEGDQDAAGQAGIVTNGEALQLVVQARLPQNERNEAYEVWLYNSDEDALSVGAQVANAQGVFQGAKELPKGYEKYKFIDVSREPVTGPKAHSGNSVLRGSFADLAKPEPEGGGAAPEQQQPAPDQPAPEAPAPEAPAPEQP
ncbi:MAG: anti-sigma factor [Thermoleophilaceae bacterium]|nr:anti-sigma factor [Thermoleophilaceae bacterium]